MVYHFGSWCTAVDHLAAVDRQGDSDGHQRHLNDHTLCKEMVVCLLQVQRMQKGYLDQSYEKSFLPGQHKTSVDVKSANGMWHKENSNISY